MLQSEPGDGEKPSPPSEENSDAPSEQTPQLKRVGLPWQFWVWQCVPMVCLIVLMPPGEKVDWWIHIDVLDWVLMNWIGLEPWGRHLAELIFTSWFCQGVLLAYWMVWGSGHWSLRFCEVVGLAAITILLPAIWFVRHIRWFQMALTPWSDVLDPLRLVQWFIWAFGISFIPAFLFIGMLHLMQFRLRQVDMPCSAQGKWQSSLMGLMVLTLACSLLLSFVFWIYPTIWTHVTMGQLWLIEKSPGRLVAALSSALTALLAAGILYWRNWRVTVAIFSFTLAMWFVTLLAVRFSSASSGSETVSRMLHLAGTLTLGNLISLAISRYWIGWNRFKLIRLSKQASRQEA